MQKGPRREDEPAALVAKADKLTKLLVWSPRYDDLSSIVSYALAWENQLERIKVA